MSFISQSSSYPRQFALQCKMKKSRAISLQMGKNANSPGSDGFNLQTNSPTASSSSKKVHSLLSAQSGKRMSMKQVSSSARNSCRFLWLVLSPSMQLSDSLSSLEVSLLQSPGEPVGEQRLASSLPWTTQETTSMAGWLCSLMVQPAGSRQMVMRSPFFYRMLRQPTPRVSSFSLFTPRSCRRRPFNAWVTP